MAAWPWVVPWANQGQKIEEFPNLQRWLEAIKARPAVERGFAVGKELRSTAPMDDEAKKVLFGQTAASVTPK